MKSEYTANEALAMQTYTYRVKSQTVRRQYKEPATFTRAHALAVVGAVFALMLAAALYL